jgi:hypothetical protein
MGNLELEIIRIILGMIRFIDFFDGFEVGLGFKVDYDLYLY